MVQLDVICVQRFTTHWDEKSFVETYNYIESLPLNCPDHDVKRSLFQLQPDFPSRLPAQSAEEQLFCVGIKGHWMREATKQSWRVNMLADDRYLYISKFEITYS